MTNDAEYLICVLYNEYLNRRADGESKSESAIFGSSAHVFEEFFAEWNIEDIDETLRELHSLGYVNCLFASNTIVCFSLTFSGIAFMEQRFGRKLDKILEAISNLKRLLF